MTTPRQARLVFLFDVDNTLLNNDFVKQDLEKRMAGFLRPEDERRFWELYETVRHETDLVNFPETLKRFGQGFDDHKSFERLDHLLNGYRFDRHLYAHALDAIAHVKTLGVAAVVSDGDAEFQPRKIAEAGITHAVDGRVFIFTHKEQSILRVMESIDGERYVMIDDKRRILASLKNSYRGRFTTVHVAQGHYAEADADMQPKPDIELRHIGELRRLKAEDFLR
jgi:FMN phosphatase YigB (HAD superfamily)